MKTEQLIQLSVEALEDLKGIDIKVLDVREMTDVTDTVIICTGTSNRHVKALSDNLIEKVKEQGIKPIGTEGERDDDWVLVDLGDLVAHLMSPKARDFYRLEALWEKTELKRHAS